VSSRGRAERGCQPPRRVPAVVMPDYALAAAAAALLALGLVMVASASLHLGAARGQESFHFVNRQALFAGLGVGLAYGMWRTPLRVWERFGPMLAALGLFLLLAVLVPGIGREVNGSMRWLPLGPFNLQVSELMKLFTVVFMAGYLVRRGLEVRERWRGLLKPLAALAVVSVLLLAEPDFGAAAVLVATVLGMLFLAGAQLRQLALVLGAVTVAAALMVLAAPYRLQRVLVFLNPWQDPYDGGFQLTQALIAFGRGDWLGVGLGAGLQKLFYLPEAHTDFLFAVIAEEMGLLGVAVVIGLFGFITLRALALGARAQTLGRPFAGYLASGLGLWLGLQAFVNMGVNVGLLPTKGLTLPLMSYGGSSLLTACLAVGLLLRVDKEVGEVGAERALDQDRCARV